MKTKAKFKIPNAFEPSPLPEMDAALIPSSGASAEPQDPERASLSQFIGEAPPPLRAAEVISRTTGVCPDVATLLCLSAAASAIGPSVVLETPLGERVNSSLPLLIPSQFDPGVRSAVGMAFGAYRESQRISAQEASRIPRKQLEADVAALVQKSRALQAVTDNFANSGVLKLSHGMRLEDIIHDSKLRGYIEGGLHASAFRKKIVGCLDLRREEITSALTKLDERAFPASLLEPIRLNDYPILRKLFKDHGFFSLDEFGTGLEELLAAKNSTKHEIGGLWSAAHDGRLLVADGQARPADWLAGLSLVSSGLLERFLTDKHLLSTGFPQRALIIVPRKGTECMAPDDDGKSALDAFSRRLLQGAKFRRTNFGDMLRVASDAVGEIEAIMADQRHVCSTHPDLAEFNQHRASQTFKLALLLHLSKPDEAPRTVPTETIRESRALMARTLERTIHAQTSAVELKEETGTLELQLEMISSKLKIKGPMTRRQLARSFHKIKMDLLDSLVEVACDRGLIEQEGAQLRLPDKSS